MAARPMLEIIGAVILFIYDREKLKLATAERVNRSVSNIKGWIFCYRINNPLIISGFINKKAPVAGRLTD